MRNVHERRACYLHVNKLDVYKLHVYKLDVHTVHV